MKKILICIQFLLLTTVAYATGQDSDVIYINGTRWALLDRPVFESGDGSLIRYNPLKTNQRTVP